MLQGVIEDRSKQVDESYMAAKIHNTFIHTIVEIAHQIGATCIVLSGGCFQNRYLTERAVQCLRQADLQAYWQQQAPPNDGGIALGQIYSAWRQLRKG
jgi:hydrogenase maturation protein HypF